VAELAARIRRQVSHLEALEADTEQALRSEAASANWLRVKARLERELQAADRALAMKPDREQAQELVDLLPQSTLMTPSWRRSRSGRCSPLSTSAPPSTRLGMI